MDILNLSPGVSGAGDSLAAVSGAAPASGGEPASRQAGFGDALLNVITTLLAEQGQTLARANVGAETATLDDDEKADSAEQESGLPLKDDAPQQLLEALLLTSQTPLKIQAAVFSASDEPSIALPIAGISTGAGVMSASGSGTLAAAVSAQDVPQPLPKTLQPVAPQVLTTLAAAPVVTPAHDARPITTPATVVGTDDAAVRSAPLKLDAEDSRWSQQLQSALGERLQMQVKNQIQHATIRLDPPELGKIDISLQIENGRMQVQISAAHADVYRALQQTSNDLRHSLTEQNFVQVNVQVSSQSQQQQGKEQPFAGQQQAVIGAETEPATAEHDASRREDDSVLLTI